MKIQRLISVGLIVAALSSVQNSSAAGVTDGIKGISMSIYQSNWHAVQDIFVTQPKEASKQSYWPMLPAAVGAGTGGFGAYLLLPLLADLASWAVWPIASKEFKADSAGYEADYIHKPTIHSPILYLAAIAGSAVGGWKLVDKVCRYRSLKAAERKQMDLVMDSWKELRAHFPEELLPACDALHKLKTENSPDYAANVDRTLCFIKKSICKHFARPLWTRVLGALHNLEY